MFKTTGTIFAVIAIGTVAIAWSHHQKPAPQPGPHAETLTPETLLTGGPLPEQQFKDLTFVYADDD
jgi:hypothetical protein